MAERRLIRAQVLYGVGHYDDAAVLLYDVVEKHATTRSYPDALFFLADCLFKKGDNLLARDYFHKVIDTLGESSPHYGEALGRQLPPRRGGGGARGRPRRPHQSPPRHPGPPAPPRPPPGGQGARVGALRARQVRLLGRPLRRSAAVLRGDPADVVLRHAGALLHRRDPRPEGRPRSRGQGVPGRHARADEEQGRGEDRGAVAPRAG